MIAPNTPYTRLMRRAAIVLLAFSACHTPNPGTVRGKTHSGRSYLVHAPAGKRASEAERPLLIMLHGRLGTGMETERHTHLTAIADREGFVVVYPDGIDRSWHDRREEGPAAEQHIDDVAFISTLIDTMVREQNVDPKRVYVAGISNGGMMTFRLACELSEKITAVGAVISALPESGAAECKPSHPMSLVMFAGTEDPLVPYNGGEVTGHRGKVLGADTTRQKFADLDGCGPPQAPVHYDRIPDDETAVTEIAHVGCQANTEVRLFSIEGGGHTWPGGPQYLSKSRIGRVSRELDMSEELWKFFSRQPAR